MCTVRKGRNIDLNVIMYYSNSRLKSCVAVVCVCAAVSHACHSMLLSLPKLDVNVHDGTPRITLPKQRRQNPMSISRLHESLIGDSMQQRTDLSSKLPILG
jgi:hypothetical protein